MELIFKISAVILGGVAAYFLWQGNADYAFAAAVFAAVSFFLSVRFQVKGRLDEREAARLEEEKRREEEEFEDEFEEAEEVSGSGAPQLNEIPAKEQIDNGQRTADKEQI